MREGGVWTFEKKKKNSQPSKRSQPKGGRGGLERLGWFPNFWPVLSLEVSPYSLCQAKIHQQEHLILKRSMQLSSAMAKEIVSPALLARLEDNLDVDLSGLAHHQFRPNTWLQTIVKSEGCVGSQDGSL